MPPAVGSSPPNTALMSTYDVIVESPTRASRIMITPMMMPVIMPAIAPSPMSLAAMMYLLYFRSSLFGKELK